MVPCTDPSDSSALPTPLVRFDLIKNYLIPKPQLCERIVTLRVGKYSVVGFPITITDSSYERNAFVFNFCFVFSAQGNSIVYETSIRRLARMFMALEEQSKYLSRRTSFNTIESILQQIYQDVNNYSECKIPVDNSTTINMKLFPIFPPPPNIKSFDVPISTVNLTSMVDDNWDPTMEKIIPYINGINSIRRISELADANFHLVKKCIQHLMHYGCIIIIDIFQFSNIYAPTPNLITLLKSPEMMKECQSYISVIDRSRTRQMLSGVSGVSGAVASSIATSASAPSGVSSASPVSTTASTNSSAAPFAIIQRTIATPSDIFTLYSSLHQGQTVRDWLVKNKELLKFIDVRRFLSFGVIKELIYRVNEYPIVETLAKKYPQTSEASKQHHIRNKLSQRTNEIADYQDHGGSSHRSIPSNSYYNSVGTYTSNASSRNSMSGAGALNNLAHGSHGSSGVTGAVGSSANSGASTGAVGSGSHNPGSTPGPSAAAAAIKNQRLEKLERIVSAEDMITSILQEPRHFDAICTDVRMSKAEVESVLSHAGVWNIVKA